MCLSTVYKNKLDPETMVNKNSMEPANIAMLNVMLIECRDGKVILTDLMERQVEITGVLVEANLVDGFVVVKETA